MLTFGRLTGYCVFSTITCIVVFALPNRRLQCFMYTFGALIEQSNGAFLNIFRKKWYNVSILLTFLTISGAYKGKILQFLMQGRQYELTVTKIKNITNFTFYSTHELFFCNKTFRKYRDFVHMNDFLELRRFVGCSDVIVY